MIKWSDALYRLLPAIHQIRDGEQREALQLLLGLIGDQAEMLQEDIQQLYDNWFVETAQDWVVPYLGDLVGYRPAEGASQPGDPATPAGQRLNRFLFPRREIANLVRRRRRKGTLSVLEDVAQDVSAWPARAIEFARQIAFTQNVQFPQPRFGRLHDARDSAARFRLDTPFNHIAHTLDVRNVQSAPGIGWWHPRKVNLFVWRRKVASAMNFRLHQASENERETCFTSYTFNRLGLPTPLYVRATPETDELGIATEKHLPIPLYAHILDDHQHAGDYYGLAGDHTKSLAIRVAWDSNSAPEAVTLQNLFVKRLSSPKWRTLAAYSLAKHQVAVDPESGRLVFSPDDKPYEVRADFHYAAVSGMGGGEYDRPSSGANLPTVFIGGSLSTGNGNEWNLLHRVRDSICSWPSQSPASTSGKPHVEITESQRLEILASDTFHVAPGDDLIVRENVVLEIAAATGAWPFIDVQTPDNRWRIKLARGSRLILSGLHIRGRLLIEAWDPEPGSEQTPLACQSNSKQHCERQCEEPLPDDPNCSRPAELYVRHSTIITPTPPKRPQRQRKTPGSSLDVQLSAANICLQNSIVGRIAVGLPHPATSGQDPSPTCPRPEIHIALENSILDGQRAAAIQPQAETLVSMSARRSTVLGKICIEQLRDAEECIFRNKLLVRRRDVGYLRFCYLPAGSHTPPRFKCVPRLSNASAGPGPCRTADQPSGGRSVPLVPRFVSTCYGRPGYCELALNCDRQIARGAEDESELGAFHDLYWPQRMAALAARLQEYTPADMESAVIYADDLHPPRYLG